MGINVTNRRVNEGNVWVDFSWAGAGFVDRLNDLLREELIPVFEKMESRARQLVRVSSAGKAATKSGKHAGKTWTERGQVHLRDTIFGTVYKRKEAKGVIGILEAGNEDVIYAVMQEFGPVSGARTWAFTPYLRPAFNEYVKEAEAALQRAVEKLLKELP